MITKNNYILIVILLFSLFIRLFRLEFPPNYVFDEVYHAFTAKEYALKNKLAWDPWATPPKGVAYEWTHPPLAKEIMTLSILLFKSTDSYFWRLPGIIFGVISVYLVYKISDKLFKNKNISLSSAFLFSIDGLNFVQSRTGMNDIYFVTFALASFLFFLKKNILISALFLGFAVSTKWTAIYLFGFYGLTYLVEVIRSRFSLYIIFERIKELLIFLLLSSVIYFATYIPYFLLGYSLENFKDLQQQMWWYHTGLKASHDYASPWWSWPLNLYPVWYYVQYYNNQIANIFTSGNIALFWLGFGAIFITLFEVIKNRDKNLILLLGGYLIFLIPWAFSPRIMFLYHYSPSIPFLCIILSYQLNKIYNFSKFYFYLMITLILISFIIYYPFLTGIPIPKEFVEYFFKTNAAKNPF